MQDKTARTRMASQIRTHLAAGLVATLLLAWGATPPAHAEDAFADAAGIGAQGYDLVAYQTDKAAVRGKPSLTVTHEGVTYRFSTEANAATFRKAPGKYLPAYGGYCAFAVATKQAKVPPNPKTFRIEDGRLLLFFNGPFEGKTVDTSVFWDKNTAAMRKKADTNWPIMTGIHLDEHGVGAQGYDLVSYVQDHAAVKGGSKFEVRHDGARYQFATEAHAEAFARDPGHYLPAYGGYCAFAVAMKNAKVPPNPKTFRLQDGRLLLFFNGPFEGKTVDTSVFWDKNPAGMQKRADTNWPGLQAK